MADFNRTYLIGNLVKDPEVKDIGGGKQVANFTIAVNRKWTGPNGEEGKEVSYLDCAAFGKKAEIIGKYLSKGRRVFVEGRLKQEKWEDKETKKMQSKIRVIVDSFNFMDGKKPETTEAIPASAGNEGGLITDEDFDAI